MKRLISVLGLNIGFTSVKQLELSDLAIEYKVKSYRVEPPPENLR
jgi:Tfp pilus assembly PilM family ATPase